MAIICSKRRTENGAEIFPGSMFYLFLNITKQIFSLKRVKNFNIPP